MRMLEMFAGYGGFSLALQLAGIEHSVAAYVERDSHAAAVLAARIEDGVLPAAPIWDDVCSFGAREWAGAIDMVSAGFNCQPFSSAGQRRGVDDERWLWGDIARIIADVGPRFVFLENVRGLVRLGLPHVLADLARLGFDAEWGCLSASAVGAPHRRERVWVLAFPRGAGREGRGIRQHEPAEHGPHVGHTGDPGRPEVTRGAHGDEGCDGSQHGDIAHSASEDVVDPDDGGRVRRGAQGASIRPATRPPQSALEGPGEDVADAARPVARREPRPNTGGGSCGAWPPHPDDHDGWERWIAAGGPEPSVRRRADGRPVGLAESLHLGGNGLVPRVAAEALAQLAARAGVGHITEGGMT